MNEVGHLAVFLNMFTYIIYIYIYIRFLSISQGICYNTLQNAYIYIYIYIYIYTDNVARAQTRNAAYFVYYPLDQR